MKITVKHKETEITIEESGSSEYKARIRFGDQNEIILKTIARICDEVLKLQNKP